MEVLVIPVLVFSWIYNRSNFIIFYEFAKVLISLLFLKELMKVLVSFFFSFFFFLY